MAKYSGSLLKYPARASFVWFAGLIAVGATLLWLPVSHRADREPISAIDAIFTATSAACVTGLTVRSTPDDFSPFGQTIILLLIQLGGIGIITVTTFITLRFGGRESIRQKAVLAQTLGAGEEDLLWVLRSVLRFVFLAEGIGWVVLATRNLLWNKDQTPAQAVWEALFHSVSAFCNAGFSLYNASLARYQGDALVNFTIMALIIVGGLGFPVVLDVLRQWRRHRDKQRISLTLHSRIMLIGTAGLLALGAGAILLLEWKYALKDLPLGSKLLVACFQGTTPRTAGFETIPMARFSDATLFLLVALMMIGAGPCSCAGGFKVSTLMVLFSHAWSRFRGGRRVQLFRRSIPAEVVDRAMATALLFLVVAIAAVTVLLVVEHESEDRFLPAVFEVASALGTVGLSVSFTTLLSTAGKIVIVTLMFLGRIGPISVFAALSRAERKTLIEYPKEEILIG
jgi:trk/ktr system potassium uptake protein